MYVRFGSVFHVMEINWKEESVTWTLILCHVEMSIGFKFWWQCKTAVIVREDSILCWSLFSQSDKIF